MTHTTPTPPDLDPFESRLLTELRAHVAARPSPAQSIPEPTAPRRPARRRRTPWVLGGAAAAATVAVAVSVGVGPVQGPAAAAAFAVTRDSHGDVTVTVHRLDDADGLQRALRADGIDADVTFSHGPSDQGTFVPRLTDPPSGPGHQLRFYVLGPSDPTSTATASATPGTQGDKPTEPPGPDRSGADACGGPTIATTATLRHEDDEWVLRIPADSPLQTRHVLISTDARGTLEVTFDGTRPGTVCSVVSLGDVQDDGRG